MTTFKNAYQQASELRTNVKAIFNAIDGRHINSSTFEYSTLASAIMDIVAASSTGFVKDICERFNSINNTRAMSDKQRWCVAFAFQKVSDEVIARVEAESVAAIEC